MTIGRATQLDIDTAAMYELGIAGSLLMEHAALSVAEVVRKRYADRRASAISIFCGQGNNGGDGYAVARLLLASGLEASVYEPAARKENSKSDADVNRQILINLGQSIHRFSDYGAKENEIVVDAVFGTAFRLDRPLSTEIRDLFIKINNAKNDVIAVDLPSGVEADSGRVHDFAIKADLTVSFIAPKTGIVNYPGRKYAGDIHIANLGLSETWVRSIIDRHPWRDPRSIDGAELKQRADETAREADSHKGSNGRIAILAGSSGMGGAAVLAGRAAISAGCGLLSLLVHENQYAATLNALPSALISVMPTEYAARLAWFTKETQQKDAVAIGPGMGQSDPTLIFNAIAHAKRLVLDADALNILANTMEESRAALRERMARGLEAAILTPHPGEARRLLPEAADLVGEDRLAAANLLAETWSSAVVLKGAGTVVVVPEGHVWINTSGNPGLGKGGSGDLLTGILVSLLGQGLSLETAVIAAVYLHGRAADLLAVETGERGLEPEGILQKLSDVFDEVEWA